jgi:Ni/Fe-hydrogenase subunit HybB-like protein
LQLNSATFLPTRLIFVSLFWLQVLLKKTVDLTTINQSSNSIDESTKQDYSKAFD